MSDVDRLSWEVLNATADDWESLAQIVPAVCRVVSDASASAVEAVVGRLDAAGLLERRIPPGEPDGGAWFRMTSAGRVAWQAAADRYVPPTAD
jgi:hypothetical protein